jgi:hypothetical protein
MMLDPLAQVGQNACQLMASLPVHSHHRAPLLSALSQHIPSPTAATLLHAASSTIRNAKRKDYSNSDLMQQKYATGVKRQKLADERVEQLCDFVAAACPTKSGERSVTYHQYTTDDSLYSAYRQSTSNPVSFNTFWRIKKWMRVRRAGRYLGQFDCSNTEICVIPHIDRDPALKPDPFPLVHIKQQHRFDYEKGLCYRSERSEGTEKKLFSFQLR